MGLYNRRRLRWPVCTRLFAPNKTLFSLSLPIIPQEKTRIFKQLTEAYNILSNAERRRQYDSKMGISRVASFYGVSRKLSGV